jgi:hypothetical protein
LKTSRLPGFNPAKDATGKIIFDATTCRSAGIDFVHDNARTADKYLIETMGAGCGWIDYDADGLLDLYLVNSAPTRIYAPKHRCAAPVSKQRRWDIRQCY